MCAGGRADIDDMIDRACRIAFSEGFAKPGDRLIISAGIPFGTPGSTNMLRVERLREDDPTGRR